MEKQFIEIRILKEDAKELRRFAFEFGIEKGGEITIAEALHLLIQERKQKDKKERVTAGIL